MTINAFIAEIKSDMESYDNAGLLDKISIYKWVVEGIKRFGANVTTLQETMLSVKDGYCELPDNFYSLYLAYECSKMGFNIPKKEDEKVLQDTLMWKEKVIKSKEWNSCDPTCVDEKENIIVENFYVNDAVAKFYYREPRFLSLGKKMNRNNCHKDCRNIFVKDNPNEIIINNTTLYANFTEGDIYMQYYGLDKDSNGNLLIPETDKGEVRTYLEYSVKLRIIEKLIINADDRNLSNLLSYFDSKTREHLNLALHDAKFSSFSPESLRRIKKKNRAEMWKYECMFPTLPGEYYRKGYQR